MRYLLKQLLHFYKRSFTLIISRCHRGIYPKLDPSDLDCLDRRCRHFSRSEHLTSWRNYFLTTFCYTLARGQTTCAFCIHKIISYINLSQRLRDNLSSSKKQRMFHGEVKLQIRDNVCQSFFFVLLTVTFCNKIIDQKDLGLDVGRIWREIHFFHKVLSE